MASEPVKPKRGRPPRGDQAARSLVTIRVTEAERELYNRAAEDAGQSLAEWLRGLVAAEMTRLDRIQNRKG